MSQFSASSASEMPAMKAGVQRNSSYELMAGLGNFSVLVDPLIALC
jgi:hypothetical protein